MSRFIFSYILFLLILPLSCVRTMLNKLKNVFCIAVYFLLVIAHSAAFTVRLGLRCDCDHVWPLKFVLRHPPLFIPVYIHHSSLVTRCSDRTTCPFHPRNVSCAAFAWCFKRQVKSISFPFMGSGLNYDRALPHCYIIIMRRGKS